MFQSIVTTVRKTSLKQNRKRIVLAHNREPYRKSSEEFPRLISFLLKEVII